MEIAGVDDKHQIMAVLVAIVVGEFLPIQLINQGKIPATESFCLHFS